MTAAVMLIAMLAMSVVLPAAAQSSRPMRHAPVDASRVIGVATPERVAEVVAESVRRPGGLIQVIVTLSGRPAVDQYIAAGGRELSSSARSAALGREESLRAEQATFASAAASVGASVVNSHTFLTNTVTMVVHPDQVAALWRLPGVVSVSPDRIYDQQDTTSVPLIGAPEVWGAATSYTGDGVIVGVIDTGIDYTHTHFGGTGVYADRGDGTDGTDSALFPAAFPLASVGAPKVIGGYDFVGDNYDARIPESMPEPDGDPVDCSEALGGGHGSHVSGTTAGWGVVAAGTTYAGPFDNTIYTNYPSVTTSFRIGPGVAPEAALVAIRVFGCNGSVNTDVLLDAIEAAVTGDFPGAEGDTDALDVLNMSLGSSGGGAYDDDPLVAAQEEATNAGLIIVDSAGNNGNATLISGSPGSANSVISVASTTDATSVGDATLIRNNGAGAPVTYAAQPGAANNATLIPFTGNLVVAQPADGCAPLTNGAQIAGNVALIIRGGACPVGFVDKQNNAFNAGASAVLVYNQALNGDNLVSMSDVGIVVGYNLPTYLIGNTAGTDLINQITALDPTPVSVTFGFGSQSIFNVTTSDQISSFSSRGGIVRSVGDLTLKPNVAAPGDSIVSARSGTGNQFYVISGTSMASPHVAGVAALMREQYPSRSVAEIKAIIMNTANNTVANGALIHPPQRVGTGRVDVVDAVDTDVIAYATDNAENVALSFGYPKVLPTGVVTINKTITIENLGATAYGSIAASYNAISDMPGVSVSVTPTVALGAGDGTTATITVTLSVDTSLAAPNTITYAFDTSTSGTTFLAEESGNIVLSAAGLPDLRVPVYAAPHVASDMSGALTLNSAYPTAAIEFNGIGVDTSGTGAVGTNIVSMVAPFELVADDGVDANLGTFEPRPGDDFPQDDNAVDIDKVGITSDGPGWLADPELNGTAYVAISTFSEWARPTEVAFFVYVDTDNDGAEDWIIYNANGSATLNVYEILAVDVNGAFGAPGNAYTLTGPKPYLNDWPGATIDTMLFKNNVMVIPVQLWLTNDGTFHYWIESSSQDGDFAVVSDTVGSAAEPFFFDAVDPAFFFNDLTGQEGGPYIGLPLWYDLDGYALPVDINPSLEVEELPDILLLHFHNQLAVERTEVLDSSALADGVGGFDLLSPANNAYVRDAADLTTVTWEDVPANGLLWRFMLTQLSTNTRLGTVADLTGLTGADDADALECDGTVCTLDATSLTLDDGQYAWTVTYTDGVGGENEASNAPFFFTVNGSDIDLVTNGGFENCVGSVAPSWTGSCKNQTSKAYTGDAYFKGAPGKFITQAVSHPAVDSLVSGDEVTLAAYVKSAPAGTVVQAKIKYVGGGKLKLKLKVPVATTGYDLIEEVGTLTADVNKIKISVGSFTGSPSVDDVSLVVTGSGPRTVGVDGVLPPPAAPDGFRGNN